MSMWAQGFEPRRDQANCGPGTKNCGKICIAQESECHVGKGKVGAAQVLGGAALAAYGGYQAMQGNVGAGTALALAGAATGLRGQYNMGRSMGHSIPSGHLGKAAVAGVLLPSANNPWLYGAGLVANLRGQEVARRTVRPEAPNQLRVSPSRYGSRPVMLRKKQ